MKFFKRNFYLSSVSYVIKNYPKIVTNVVLKDPVKELTLEESILNSLKGKLIYNSRVTGRNKAVRWKIRAEKLKVKNTSPEMAIPVCLQQLYSNEELRKYDDEDISNDLVEEDNEFDESSLPYKITKSVDIVNEELLPAQEHKLVSYQDITPAPIHGRNWMSDYECFDEELNENSCFQDSGIDYGTSNPKIPVSNVPCGGCGAHLHCKNPSIPGFLPQELFKSCSKKELNKIICQRCTFLKNYNTALAVNVDPESYPKLLAKIKGQKALVILLVDMTDFPCSIWPNLLETIGPSTPIIVVGNKIDLLPGDSSGWLEQAKKSLMKELPKNANILHVTFTSAKTAYGVEELINKLYSNWGAQGDVYLVGCTNVGKSSLFNALINSDYCRTKAIDLIQRAVTSPWPGTTLNLLKFPIQKLTGWKAFMRTSRLMNKHRMEVMETKLAKLQAEDHKIKISKLPKIIGTIDLTFKTPAEGATNALATEEIFIMPTVSKRYVNKDTSKVFSPKSHDFKSAHWCYDTPGVVHKDQIIDLFTIDEIMKLLPQNTIRPRIFSIRPEQTLYIGGAARVDVLNCDNDFIRLIVYASNALPITLCETKYAEDVYKVLTGTSYFAVPCGSEKRLSSWPALNYGRDFEIRGSGYELVCSEIVLSSVGWIGISAPRNVASVIRPWTPEGRGIHERKTPVLKLTARLRRSRIYNTPTYHLASI